MRNCDEKFNIRYLRASFSFLKRQIGLNQEEKATKRLKRRQNHSGLINP